MLPPPRWARFRTKSARSRILRADRPGRHLGSCTWLQCRGTRRSPCREREGLPSRAPELNPVENIWQYLRANWLSTRVFAYEDIIDAACEAWRKLIAQPKTITSIATREWALIGQT